MNTYHRDRALAIGAGAAATMGAVGLLLSDAIKTGHWTADHALVPLVVGLTIVTGHMASTALMRRRWLAALGCGIGFAIGTGITVLNGVGRQTDGIEARIAAAEAHNSAIAAAKADAQQARERLAKAHAAVERESTGQRCRSRCEDAKRLAAEIKEEIADIEKRIAEMGGEKVASPKAKKVGDIATALGWDGAQASALTLLIEPFLLPLLLEWVAICGFAVGLTRSRTEAHTAPEAAVAPVAQAAAPTQPTPPQRPGKGRGRKRDPNVVSFVQAFRARHGRAPNIPEMRAEFPDLNKTTLWRNAKAC